MSYDLVALGETMVALSPPPGDKVQTAERLLVDHAGAESNTCVGLARLGFRVAWVSALGADAAGDRVYGALAAEGIELRWVRRDSTRPTGLMLKDPEAGVRYYRTGSAASAMGPEVLAHVPVSEARAVLVTGITALLGEAPHAAGLALLESARGLRIVDPNLRGGLWGSGRRVELILPFLERCDLLLAGAHELAELCGEPDERRAATEIARRGPREVVIRGPLSVAALSADGWEQVAIRRDAAVDAIGAGDAFNAGYIAVRLRGGTVAEALRTAVRCGAAVTASPSDTAGFPRGL